MNTAVILGIALGLAMDCLAVAIASSVALRGVTPRQTFRLSFHFGLFQLLMPIVGWLAGLSVEAAIARLDHWVAFGLLSFVGVKSIWTAVREDGAAVRVGDPTRGLALVVLSVATSVDALAVGFSYAMLGVRVWVPSVVIGVVSGAVTAVGMQIGSSLGERFGKRMEVVGGLVLVAIGLKILVDHLA